MAGVDWARRIVQKALNREVHIHDDNSQPSMYDLLIGTADAPDEDPLHDLDVTSSSPLRRELEQDTVATTARELKR
jgi:hypothetical protein